MKVNLEDIVVEVVGAHRGGDMYPGMDFRTIVTKTTDALISKALMSAIDSGRVVPYKGRYWVP